METGNKSSRQSHFMWLDKGFGLNVCECVCAQECVLVKLKFGELNKQLQVLDPLNDSLPLNES